MFFSSVPLSTGCTSTVRGVLKDLIFKIVSLFEHFSETRNCSLPFPSSHSESPSFCKPGREGGRGRGREVVGVQHCAGHQTDQ